MQEIHLIQDHFGVGCDNLVAHVGPGHRPGHQHLQRYRIMRGYVVLSVQEEDEAADFKRYAGTG